jgi:hypothetical protein
MATMALPNLIPVPVHLRPDGRGLPLGCVLATDQFGAGATVIAAIAGWRFLIASMTLTGGNATAGTTTTVQGTMNGSVQNILVNQANSPQNQFPSTLAYPSGMLLDDNTAVAVTWSGTALQDAFVSIFYDPVPAT